MSYESDRAGRNLYAGELYTKIQELLKNNVKAALEGLTMQLHERDNSLEKTESDVNLLTAVLENVGDGLRFETINIPQELRNLLKNAKIEALSEVLGNIIRDELTDPTANFSIEGDTRETEREVLFEQLAKTRDRAESALIGVNLASTEKGVAPIEISNFGPFLDALEKYDQMLTHEGMTSTTATSALGNRRFFLKERNNWTRNLPTPSGSSVEIARLRKPPEEVLLEYILTGEPAKWVEDFAHKHADFQEELAEVIEDLKESGEDVSIRAQQWLDAHPKSNKPNQKPSTLN